MSGRDELDRHGELVALIAKAVTNKTTGQTEMFPLVAAEKAVAALRKKPDVVLRALGYRQHGFICLDSKCGTWTEDDSECPMGHDTDDPLPAVPFYVKEQG